MQIINPSLVLTFTRTNQSVTTQSLVKDSISITEQLYNGLKASSNTVSLSLVQDNVPIYQDGPTLIEAIIAENADITAVLKDGNVILYTGYLSDNYSWGVGLHGEDVFKINLEGVGTRLLNKPFINSEGACIREKFSDLIDQIKTKCQNLFTVIYDSSLSSADWQTIKDKYLINKVTSKVSCQTLLDEICFELGLVYYFNNYGNLVLSKTNIEAQASKLVLSADEEGETADCYFYVSGSQAVSLSKKAKQYKQVKVKYSTIKDSGSVVPVYALTDKLTIAPEQWWDGQFHTETIYDLTLDEFFQSGKTYYINTASGYQPATVTVGDPIPEGQYYEYAGGAATVNMSDLQEGHEIIYVYPSTVLPNLSNQNTSYSSGGVNYVTTSGGFNNSRWTLKQHGNTDRLEVLIDNTQTVGTQTVYTSFRAGARIITKDGTASIYRAFEDLTANSENQYEYEAKWIHSKSDVKSLTELLNNYYAYCNNTYTFYTKGDLDLGSVVRLKENLMSGLDVNVFLTARQYTCYGQMEGLYKYTAQAVSEFDLTPTVSDEIITPYIEPPALRTTSVRYAASSDNINPPSSGWSDTVPDLDPINCYLWQEETIVYVNGYTEVRYAVIGAYGDRGLSRIFEIEVSPSNFIQDRRRTDSQTFTIECNIQGYEGTPTISFYYSDEDQDNPYEYTASSVTFQIPYDNSHPSMVIKAELTGAPTQHYTVSAIDETEKYLYFGQFGIDTSSYFDSDGQLIPENYSQIDWSPLDIQLGSNEKFIEGDSFFNNYSESGFEDYYIYVYQAEKWIPISFSTFSNGIKSDICGKAQKDVLSTIQPGTVTKSDYGYFNTIIAGTITSDFIGSQEIEVQNGGFIYAGDVDTTQPAGSRVGSSGAGFCFDSLGNAELSNIRVTGDSTIEGGSTVLGTLINYDANGNPVFRTVKDTNTRVSMSGSKVDGTSAPSAYVWSEFFNYFNNEITTKLTDGTAYNASGTMGGTWDSTSITSKAIRGVRYYATAPDTAFSQDPQYGMINGIEGDLNSNQVETKTIWTNTGRNTVHFDHVTAYPKTESGPLGQQTQAGSFSIDVCNSGGAVIRTFIDAGTQGPSASTRGFERTASNIDVPPGGFIQARWGTWGWSRRGSHGWVKLFYRDSDNFTQGINLIVSNGSVYNSNDVIPNLSSYSTYAQSLTITGTSVSFDITMTAASSWPSSIEKYYRFSYTQSPGTTSTITTSIFDSQSFSYRGTAYTITSATFNNSMLKVRTTSGHSFEFYTAAGYYYPRHSFSIVTLGEELGAYMRSVMPTDDALNHNIGASTNYDSGNPQRWDTGFFTSLDVSQGIVSKTINSSWYVPIITANYTITDAFEVGTMRPYFINSSSTISLTMPGDSSQNYVILALNVVTAVLIAAGKSPRYIAVNGGSSTNITWTGTAEPYMLVYVLRIS